MIHCTQTQVGFVHEALQISVILTWKVIVLHSADAWHRQYFGTEQFVDGQALLSRTDRGGSIRFSDSSKNTEIVPRTEMHYYHLRKGS